MPKVSVIITTYNSMPYFPETLTSVLRQSFTDFEIIIIDDGSTDQTTTWTSQINDPRVKLISQSNQGVSVARNTGISHAQGKYLAFLDGDDLWKTTKLEQQVRLLDDYSEIGLVHTWLALIDEQSHLTGRVMQPVAEGEVWQQIIENNMVACSAAMVRRCCLEKVGGFDPDLLVAEDWDLWIRLAASYPFAVIRKPLVEYRLHTQSKSKRYPAMVQNFHVIIERAFESVPYELLHLRNRSYGRVNLCIAWKCIQRSDPEFEMATNFCHQALLHYPQLRFSREYIRLITAIKLMQWFGPQNYSWLLNRFNTLRRRLATSSSS
ncbi:glycosyltransferase [Acaryochloris sp. IP29b_bin.148]|uniref:glycosyltransferase family 2 protein n=1 Tax=Acaryochloris sp. IP29b_bin.148 TaxID=2969218 RepID=UPI0026091DA2|nr:glycosyltransferase [Acaryochloris sp. IP29b_bin.148]